MISRLESKNLRLGKVKYFDVEHNGVEVNDIDAYVFLYNINGHYVNIFNICEEEYPVFERVPYTNATLDGEDFGTKLMQVAGDSTKSGPCYILEKETGKDIFDCYSVTMNTIQDYMFSSPKFFVDRYDILTKNVDNHTRRLNYYVLLKDEKDLANLEEYFASHEPQKVYKK